MAFSRGEGEVVVAVALRGTGEGVAIDVPAGDYRDVLSGSAVTVAGPLDVARVTEPHGFALLERV